MNFRNIPLRQIVTFLPGLVLITAGLATRPANMDDFRTFYRAAELVHSPAGLYANPRAYTLDNFLPFVRVPSYAWILTPLHWFGYATARGIWTGVLVLAFGLFLWLTRERRDATALAVSCSFPVAYALVLGQDISLVMLIVMAAVRLHAAKRDFAAGVAASWLVIKVTYFWPVALVFLARSRRGVFGLVVATAAQLAWSFAIAGWGWPFQWIKIVGNPLLDPEPRRMLSVRALAAPFPYSSPVFAIAAVLLIAWLWYLARRLSFEDAMIVALPLGLISSPHCYVYDAVVLIPLLVSVASPRTWTGRLALLALTPVPYYLICGTTPEGAFIGSACVVASVVCSTIQVYRERGLGSGMLGAMESFRLTPDSVAPASPAM